MSTKSLSESLEALFKKMGQDTRIKQYDIIRSWPNLVGDRIGSVTRADSVRDRILYVHVKSPAWRTEMMFQKHSILKQIEKSFGKGLITDIRFL